MRIVSLIPSATEILFAVGAGDDVVGVTFECDHPPAARERRVVSTSAMPEGLTPHGLAFLVDHLGTRPIDPDKAREMYEAPPGVDLYYT